MTGLEKSGERTGSNEKCGGETSKATDARVLTFASSSKPGYRTGVVRQKSNNIPGGEIGLIRKELESYPDIDDNGDEFQRVDMQAFFIKIHRFACIINMLHGKTEEQKIRTHDAPHDLKFGRPTSETTVRGVR
jgi:hypothetical protein